MLPQDFKGKGVEIDRCLKDGSDRVTFDGGSYCSFPSWHSRLRGDMCTTPASKISVSCDLFSAQVRVPDLVTPHRIVTVEEELEDGTTGYRGTRSAVTS